MLHDNRRNAINSVSLQTITNRIHNVQKQLVLMESREGFTQEQLDDLLRLTEAQCDITTLFYEEYAERGIVQK